MIPVFDIDLTLLKGSPIHNDAQTFAIRSMYGLPNAARSDISLDGKIDTQIIAEIVIMHGISELKAWEKMPDAIKVMEEYYEEHKSEDYVELLPGVKELLVLLREHKIMMGVLTGNIEKIGWHKLEMAGIDKYFSFGAFSDKVKSRPELVPLAKKKVEEILKMEINSSDLVVIGDTSIDIQSGKTNGTKTIGVATGRFNIEQLTQSDADLVLKSFDGDHERNTILGILGR